MVGVGETEVPAEVLLETGMGMETRVRMETGMGMESRARMETEMGMEIRVRMERMATRTTVETTRPKTLPTIPQASRRQQKKRHPLLLLPLS